MTPPDWAIPPPLYLDAEVLAFDKPAGLLTIPGRDLLAPSLWRLAEVTIGARLWAVHRLDRETSGVVIFARTAVAHRALSMAFEQRLVQKRYLARVAPRPPSATAELLHRLVPARRGFMRLARDGEGGQLAQTRYRVLAVSANEALVELLPLTGRTHQLRLQLASMGSPIVGEPHYRACEEAHRQVADQPAPVSTEKGCRESEPSRLWLHAHQLRLAHPLTAVALLIEAPPPTGLWSAAS